MCHRAMVYNLVDPSTHFRRDCCHHIGHHDRSGRLATGLGVYDWLAERVGMGAAANHRVLQHCYRRRHGIQTGRIFIGYGGQNVCYSCLS